MTTRSGRFCAVVFRFLTAEPEPSASEHASTANEGVLIWPRRTFRAFRLQVGAQKPPSTDSHKTSFYSIETGLASMISRAKVSGTPEVPLLKLMKCAWLGSCRRLLF